ncbi:MAG TPA: hypothetical protein VIV40_12085, partial [Kofleriaceae bacterium]
MRAQTRPFIILPDRPDDATVRGNHIKLVPHACEACGELTTRAVLCLDCQERTRPYQADDPYDDVGG